MSSSGIAAGGTLLGVKYTEVGSGASSGYDNIAEVFDITGPSLSSDTADITNHDSFSGEAGWEEHVGTVLRSGEVTFDINEIPTNDTHNYSSGNTTAGSGQAPELLYLLESKVKTGFKLTFPDTGNTEWKFNALVTGFEPS